MSWLEISPTNRELAETVLTTKQLEVLRLVIDGHSFRAIGRHLRVTEATVRGHYERALDKMGEAMKENAA